MGASQSRSRNAQYHMPTPGYAPYGPQAPPPPPPPPFVPYGYGQPMYPPGFAPPNPQFGQGPYAPPPLLNFLPQDRRGRRSSKAKYRRSQSERFVGGLTMPQPEGPSRRHRSESYSRPVVPPTPSPVIPSAPNIPHRTPTPFIPPYGRPDEYIDENEDDDDPFRTGRTQPNRSSSRRRSTPRYPTPPPVIPDLPHVLEPLDPASSAVFGPPGPRPQIPLRNPLPPPPRDLYEMSPYKSLLNLPQTTALLTATYAHQHATNGGLTTDPLKRKKSGKGGGLLRAFSRKDKHKESAQPQVRFVPVFVPSPNDPSTSQAQGQGQQQPLSAHTTATGPAPLSANSFNSWNATTSLITPNTADFSQPVPPVPSSPPTIRFDHMGRYAAFMNQSPHRVLWEGLPYRTALHLHEALQFMETRPDLAEKIRVCERLEDVYPLSANFRQFRRPDWGNVFLGRMKEVLYEKFRQHPDLRSLLLSTGTARLIYVDGEDLYWGSGPGGTGQNNLGISLMEVRNRLMNESTNA